MLTMFPRQDVGVKGSSPVQECLRQPVYAEIAVKYGKCSVYSVHSMVLHLNLS